MTDPVRVLYVAADDETGRRLESACAADHPSLAVSSVASVDAALAVLDADPVDHVVVDAAVLSSAAADRPAVDRPAVDPATALRGAQDDVTVHVVRRAGREPTREDADPARDDGVRALADRVASVIAADRATVESRHDLVADGGEDGEQFRALAETLSDALLVVDADSVVQYANPAVESVFGYAPDELVGDSLTKLMSPEMAERHREGVNRYLDTGERALDWDGVELVGRRKDGTSVPVEISFSEFTADGEIRFAGVIRDVTQRNRRERELRDRVRQQRAVATFSRWALEDRPLHELFDEAVELVADSLDHDYAKVLELQPDEGNLLLRAGVGWNEDVIGSATFGTDRASQAGYTLLSNEPIVVEDFPSEERFAYPDLKAERGLTSGVSTIVGSPGDPWGVLETHATDQREYADHDVQFVESVAHLLAAAIRRRERERDLQRREEMLTALTGIAGTLADAETPDAICEVAVDAAVEVLDLPNAAVALYDDEASDLVPAVRRWAGDAVDDALIGDGSEGVAWRTFVESESRVIGDLGAASATDSDAVDAGTADDGTGAPADQSSALAVPLGKYGVFLAAAPEPEAFDAADRSFADLLCSNVRSALDRAEREETLRERRDELRQKNRELERVNRINGVVRELTKAVTRASSPEEVMQAACDRLTETGPYRFAWFGTHDRATDEIEPRAWAGVGEGYLDEVRVTADDGRDRGRGPAGRALRTKEVQVQNDLLGDPPFEPWREQALRRGYRSSASVPVVYGETVRGVLNLYAGEPDVFDATERAVLAELGEFVGYALNALEQRQALASERSVELDFRIRGSTSPVLVYVSETGASFEFENAVQRDDGRLHAFFTVSGAPPEETMAFVEDVSWVEDVRLVTDRGDEHLFEATLGEDAFLRSLVDRGAMPRTVTATDGEGRFVVRIPHDADVRTFVNLFDDYYDGVELVARRERDEPVMTRQEFEAELAERLTDRQREVVQTAYFAGFFEWPRESTAQEIADALGVSQPTVSRHVRGAERVLFGLLFEDR